MTDTRPAHIAAPVWLGVLLIVTGLAGLLGSFSLSVERVELLVNPQEALGCDLNPFLTCSGAINSDQGELFGFPNPFLGLMAFPAPIIMGALTLGRVAMPRWVWTVFSVGVLGGMAIVLYLAQQSIFFLGFAQQHSILGAGAGAGAGAACAWAAAGSAIASASAANMVFMIIYS